MRRRELALLAALGAGALLVRLLTYRTALPATVNADEFAWTWAGQSLLTQGSPSSWSVLHAYAHSTPIVIPYANRTLPFVHHWLDHPPLFALVAGAAAVASGETQPESVTLGVIRLVPVLLSTATVVLLYLLVRRRFTVAVAALAAAALAFTPAAVQASALVEAEWLLAPLLIVALLVADRSTWLLLGICAIAPMVKVTGVSVGVAAAAYLLTANRTRWRLALGCAAAAGAGIGLYAAYGAWVDWSQFTAVIQSQSARHTTNPFVTGASFLFDARAGAGGSHAWNDPLWYIGLGALVIGGLAAAVRRRWWALNTLIVPVAVYAVVMALSKPTTGASVVNGWYRIAIYPLVYAAAAWLAVSAAQLAVTWRRHAAATSTR
jgi:hypothetical protein